MWKNAYGPYLVIELEIMGRQLKGPAPLHCYLELMEGL